MEGNLRFKIDWASLIVGRKITPVGAYIWRGDLTEVFLRSGFGGFLHGGAYFRNFTECLL